MQNANGSVTFTVKQFKQQTMPHRRADVSKVQLFETCDAQGRVYRFSTLRPAWFVGCRLRIMRGEEMLIESNVVRLYGDMAGGGKHPYFTGLSHCKRCEYSDRVNSLTTAQLQPGDRVVVSGPYVSNLYELIVAELYPFRLEEFSTNGAQRVVSPTIAAASRA